MIRSLFGALDLTRSRASGVAETTKNLLRCNRCGLRRLIRLASLGVRSIETCFPLLLLVVLSGCASFDKYSFETFVKPPPGDRRFSSDHWPARSDARALLYADYQARLLEGRATGSRLTRELSDSSLVVGGALAGAQETLGIAASSVAKMGVGMVITRELQGIFNARGRSEAFADAAYLIRQAQSEFRLYNPNPSAGELTENGAILISRVDAAVHAARKTLNGRMPGLLDLKQATQPMTEEGANRQSSGAPQTIFTAAGTEVSLPRKNPERSSTPDDEDRWRKAAEEEKKLAVLFAEVKTAQDIALAKNSNDRDFYTKALAHIGITVPAGTGELTYLNKKDKIRDRQTLEKLRDYYKALAGTTQVPIGQAVESDEQRRIQLRKEVKAAAEALPATKRNDMTFFPNELTKAGADNLTATTLESFKVHVDSIHSISQLETLLRNLNAGR